MKDIDETMKARVTALVCSCFDMSDESIPWHKIHAVVGLEVDDRLVSVLLVTYCSEYAAFGRYAFEKVCTTPKMQKRGYGRWIVNHAVQRFSPAVLHVNRGPSHDRLVDFYFSCGFDKCHRQTMNETMMRCEYTW